MRKNDTEFARFKRAMKQANAQAKKDAADLKKFKGKKKEDSAE